jgi:type IV secretory pathway TraG/TraD family ATPase VirD4
MAFPFSSKPKLIGSADPRAMYAGCYRYPNDKLGGEIRIADTRPKVLIGGNSSGKTAGVVLPNLLRRTGVSQFAIDTRLQAAAIAAPWRRTVDDETLVSNPYGSLSNLPEYADLQGGAGINLLEAAELDPDHPLCTDHLNVMAQTALPAENDHQPYFPTAAQSVLIAFTYGELVDAKRQGRKPLFANVRRKVLERSEYDATTGEPVTGMAFHARQILTLNNPFVNSCIDRFSGQTNDELLSVIGTFEADSRWMMSPMLAADEERGGMDFGKMGRRVCSSFLGVPAEHVDAAAPWFRLAVSKALRPLFAPHDIPVTFWIDEFYAVKRIPAIESALGVVAGSKLEIVIVVQSLTMLAHLYSKVWEAFLSQASAIILVGSPGDKFTCDYLVDRSCDTTFIQPNAGWSVNPGGFGITGGGGYHTGRTLTAHDLYNLKPGTGFIWLAGLADPIPAAYPGYYTDPVLSRRARRDPYVRW